jgi:hypothetical protein
MTSWLNPFMLKADCDRSVNGIFDLCEQVLDLVQNLEGDQRGPRVVVLGADLGLLLDHLAPRVWTHQRLRTKIFCLMSGWHAGKSATEAGGECSVGDGGHLRLFRAGLAKSVSAAEQGYAGGDDKKAYEMGSHLVEADFRQVADLYVTHCEGRVLECELGDDSAATAAAKKTLDGLRELLRHTRAVGPSATRWLYGEEGREVVRGLEKFAAECFAKSECFQYEIQNRFEFCKYLRRLFCVT